MQLLSMEVNHLGTGDRLQVGTLSPGLNALCGRRGTGKTSLVRWLRGMLHATAQHAASMRAPTALPIESAARWDHAAGRVNYLLGDLEHQIDRVQHAGCTISKVLQRAASTWDNPLGRSPQSTSSLSAESLARYQSDAFEALTAIASDDAACNRLWDLARKFNLDQPSVSPFAEERSRLARREGELVAELLPLDALTAKREDLLARRRQLEHDLERARRDSIARQFTPATDEHHRLGDRLAALDRDAQKLRGEITELEAALAAAPHGSTAQPVFELALERAPQGQSYRQRLFELDAQLARWRNTLAEIRSHRERLESAATDAQLGGQLGEQFSPVNQATPRQALRALEVQITEARRHFDRLLEGVDRYRADNDEARNELPQTLRLMQRELHEVCQQLSRHESLTSNRANREQILQLTRCESEMRLAIERLIAERGELLRSIATACHLSVDQVTVAYSDACRCADHPPLDAWLTAISPASLAPRNGEAVAQRSQSHADALARIEARRSAALLRLDDCERERREMESRLQRLGAAPIAAPLSDHAENELLQQLELVADEIGRLETRERLRSELADVRRRLHLLPPDVEDKNSLRGRLARHVRGLAGRPADAGNAHPAAQLASAYVAERDQRAVRLQEVALRLAIVQTLAADGVCIPVVLDQTLDGLDAPQCLTVAQYLSSFCAGHGIQVIALTEDLDLAEAVKAVHGNVAAIVVSRAVASQPSPLESDVNRQLLAYANDFEADKWGHSVTAAASAARQNAQRRFVLVEQSEIEAVPSISPLVAARLRAVGLDRVSDLLDNDHHWIADSARLEGVSAESVFAWQSEARLLCAMPQLRPFDARVLAGAGVRDARQLAAMHPSRLLDRVERFLATERGRQIMRSGSSYELSRITAWIASAKRGQHTDQTDDSPAFGVEPSTARPRVRRDTIQRQHPAHSAAPTYHIVERDDLENTPQRPSSSAVPSAKDSHAERRRPRGDRAERVARGDRRRRGEAAASDSSGDKKSPVRLQFHLDLSSAVVEAPSIGAAMASQLEKIGIATVDDLLASEPDAIAAELGSARVTSAVVRSWQDQARLVCCVPNLRGHDAHILVACGLTSPEALSQADPSRLCAKAAAFAKSPQGQRVLRGSQAPDLAEVTNWIKWSAKSRSAA